MLTDYQVELCALAEHYPDSEDYLISVGQGIDSALRHALGNAIKMARVTRNSISTV